MTRGDTDKIWGVPIAVAMAIVGAVLALAAWQGSTNATITTMGNTIAQHAVQIKAIEDGRVLNEQRLTRIETTLDATSRTVDRIEQKLEAIQPGARRTTP